jgi:lipoprotein-anchoring transpeptidase ErfK/SrfK
MFVRAASAMTTALVGLSAGLAVSLAAGIGVPGTALAQVFPPPPFLQPYSPPRPPAQIDDDDDLGPPATFGFPGNGRPPAPPNTQYGRPMSPEPNPYPPPPGVANPQLGYGVPPQEENRPPMPLSVLPPDYQPETGPTKELPPQFRRTLVEYRTKEPSGTIIIDTPHTYLYLVMPGGKALRYGIGVGREGFTWAGTERVSKMAQWPDWYPPPEMIERQPYLPRFMAGGEGNPLGARALYLGKTIYRIHGTNQPSTIGSFVSSGCIRLTNEDVTDLFTRVQVGTRVVVLPGGAHPETAQAGPYTPISPAIEAAPLPPPPVRTR